MKKFASGLMAAMLLAVPSYAFAEEEFIEQGLVEVSEQAKSTDATVTNSDAKVVEPTVEKVEEDKTETVDTDGKTSEENAIKDNADGTKSVEVNVTEMVDTDGNVIETEVNAPEEILLNEDNLGVDSKEDVDKMSFVWAGILLAVIVGLLLGMRKK